MRIFYGPLSVILLRTNDLAGPTWAWRATRLAHSLPFGLGAFALGCAVGWASDGPISPVVGGVLCAAGFYTLACWDWFKEWRRGY
jgi:hypothetical protein